MNLHQTVRMFSFGLLLFIFCRGISMAQAEERLIPILKAQYDVKNAELRINSHEQVLLTSSNPTHHARRKEIVFFIPNSTLQPTPQKIRVERDPIVKSIELVQRALEGVPAVRVQVNLYTNAPYLPFVITSDNPGLKLTFSREANPDAAFASNQSIGQSKPEAVLKEQKQNPVIGLTANPSTSIQNSQPSALGSAPANRDKADSILGLVSPEAFSVISDIFYEDNSLTVVSQKHPIAIKRSFLLQDPNRYVVDISPAVLISRSLMNRAVAEANPDIFHIRAGQFDEETVRIVIQFADRIMPVHISQWEGDRVLRLNF